MDIKWLYGLNMIKLYPSKLLENLFSWCNHPSLHPSTSPFLRKSCPATLDRWTPSRLVARRPHRPCGTGALQGGWSHFRRYIHGLNMIEPLVSGDLTNKKGRLQQNGTSIRFNTSKLLFYMIYIGTVTVSMIGIQENGGTTISNPF